MCQQRAGHGWSSCRERSTGKEQASCSKLHESKKNGSLRVSLQPLKMHCRSCALVTSSGHLLGSRQGRRIDESECVIRMNDAPTRGYGNDVGNKTSLRVIAHSSIQRILRNRNELLNMSHGAVFIFWGPSSYMRRDGKGLVYNNLQLMNQILPQLKVYMISRHKMLQFDDLFKRETGKDRYPTLGLARAGSQ
uniref:ST6 N-acetylgalactosaminide alpha-2,6-sialyltransferase 5 n=1 Tax=Serinus canaria TaxID=9135 RepID=A0A8C9UGJ4_SERCA